MAVRALRATILCVIALAAPACQRSGGEAAPAAPPVPAPPVHYDGATTISNKVLPLVLPELERRGISVQVDRSGAGKGFQRLFAGEIDVAGMSRSLTPDELSTRPFIQIIGYDALGVFVNDANPVRALTKEQLKGLFTGRIRSWREVGGKDVPVLPCTERFDSGRATLEAVRTLALDGAPYGKTVRELEDPADCLALVRSTPGAVAAATMTYAIPGIHVVALDGLEPIPANVRSSQYLLTRPLLLVTLKPPTGPTRDLLEFMRSPDGQALVTRAGFVPAR